MEAHVEISASVGQGLSLIERVAFAAARESA